MLETQVTAFVGRDANEPMPCRQDTYMQWPSSDAGLEISNHDYKTI